MNTYYDLHRYTLVEAEQILNLSAYQINSLVAAGVLTPCSIKQKAYKKYYFSETALISYLVKEMYFKYTVNGKNTALREWMIAVKDKDIVDLYLNKTELTEAIKKATLKRQQTKIWEDELW